MPPMTLIVGGRSDSPDATHEEVEQAILAMAAPDGPTYIVLQDGSGSSMQAAGTNDVYVVEACFGAAPPRPEHREKGEYARLDSNQRPWD